MAIDWGAINDEMTLSSVCGAATTVIYVLVSQIMDGFVTSRTSTLIGLFFSGIINFFMQAQIFTPGSMTRAMFAKFIIGDVFIALLLTIIFAVSKKYESAALHLVFKKLDFLSPKTKLLFVSYYNTIVRTMSASLTFFIVDYPLRKLFVFA